MENKKFIGFADIPEDTKEEWDKMPICDGCGNKVDLDVCWCGESRNQHVCYSSCTMFVPWGCTCYMLKKE